MKSVFEKVTSEIHRGISTCKCAQCGCMRGTLEGLKASLPTLKNKEAKELLKEVKLVYKDLKPLKYSCFGCKFCIPAEAMTLLTKEFPRLASSTLLSCEFAVGDDWPTVDGEYTVLDRSAPVAVTTLASLKLEEKIAKIKPEGLCIIGKTETENIGIDKLVKNIITNPAIRYLILAGEEAPGHKSGATIMALWRNGVDKNMRVIDSPGRRPVLKNLNHSDVRAFRSQIEIDDQQGCSNITTLKNRIKALAKRSEPLSAVGSILPQVSSCGCGGTCHPEPPKPASMPVILNSKSKAEKRPVTARVKAVNPKSVKLDKAGYFVIMPFRKNKVILVEHYNYENKLLRVIEGKNSRELYFTIINNKWISELSHAAYLGKELARAELSIKNNVKFVQDGA